MSCSRLLALCLALSLWLPLNGKDKIRVLCWSERTEPASVYPNGINGALVEMLAKDDAVIAKIANIYDADQGLSEEALAKTDVLIWFGHEKHADVTQEHVDRVVKRVQAGMGFIALHSAHYAHPFQQMLLAIAQQKNTPLQGTPGSWAKVTNDGKPEHIHILDRKHPIVQGIKKDFTIPRTETYFTPFNVPAPDVKILEGQYDGGQQDGSDGLLWSLGSGKIFYFRPGHETYPIYYQPEVRHILRNAVHFLAARPT
jgi:trehalose utilization protein